MVGKSNILSSSELASVELDQERTASMADEGGAAGAAMEAQESLTRISAVARTASTPLLNSIVFCSAALLFTLGAFGIQARLRT